MREPILIAAGLILAILVTILGLRLGRAMSSGTTAKAEDQVSPESDETDASDAEIKRAQTIWRRSHSK